MKVLVTYMSLSGNTKKIAEAIFQEIYGEKEIRQLDLIDDITGYDLVFVGLPMHGFGVPEEGRDFLEKQCQGKKIALFVTHGAPEESTELQPWLDKFTAAAAGADLLGMFNCQGELAQYVVDALLKSDNPRHHEYAKAAHTTMGQPDAARVERARVFARSLMGKF